MDSQAPLIVVVLGPYRSGTSLTARLLGELGVNYGPTEDLIPANDLNPTGYQERDDINEANHAFIRSARGTLEHPGTPEQLAFEGDLSLLKSQNLSWMTGAGIAGIKDPRMCATLLAWFRAGLLSPARCRVVHIIRNLDANTASAIRHDTVAGYCDRDPGRIRAMISLYAEHAQWHAGQNLCPVFTLDYDGLVNDPRGTTVRLAAFLGVTDPVRIRRAAGLVGKNKALRRLAWRDRLRQLRIFLGGVKQRLLPPFR